MDKVLLIDGSNFLYRSCVIFGPTIEHSICVQLDDNYKACKHPCQEIHCLCGSPWDQRNHKCYGEQYAFVFNFFRNLRPIVEQMSPEKIFFVLEGRPQFRYDLYPDYKANRRIVKQASIQNVNERFQQAKDIVVPLLKNLPLTIIRAADYEADDVIATICQDLQAENLTVISNDSDYIQLLQLGYPQIRIYNPIKKVDMEAPAYPYVAWKCLHGDKSDNIRGLLTPRKALATVNDPQLFKNFLSQEENRANFSINRQLIEFRRVPDEELLITEGYRNFNALKQAFASMKFQTVIATDAWKKYCKTFDCVKF